MRAVKCLPLVSAITNVAAVGDRRFRARIIRDAWLIIMNVVKRIFE